MNKGGSTKKQKSSVLNVDTNSRPALKIDWSCYTAAKYAVENWHYSKSLSSSRNVYLGVWENGAFVGCVVFGLGSGGATDGKRFGLAKHGEMAELTRIALNAHFTPVSRIISIAVRMLRRQSPGLRLLISFADPRQGHYGGIYQAAGWVYNGQTDPEREHFYKGKWRHHRSVTSLGSPKGLPVRRVLPKFRYLLALDDDMREQVSKLGQVYPKKPCAGSVDSDAPDIHSGEGGAEPTSALYHHASRT